MTQRIRSMPCITAFVNMQSNCACELKVCIAFVVQEKFAKNKVNRGNVQLHQKTGSRSYIAHRYSLVILLLSLLGYYTTHFWVAFGLLFKFFMSLFCSICTLIAWCWPGSFCYYAMQTEMCASK